MDYVCRYNEERIWLIFIGEVYFLGERYNVLIKFIKIIMNYFVEMEWKDRCLCYFIRFYFFYGIFKVGEVVDIEWDFIGSYRGAGYL